MPGKPVIHAFFDESTNTVSYIVADPATREAAVIDPVLDYDPSASQVDTRSVDAILGAVKEHGYSVAWTLETATLMAPRLLLPSIQVNIRAGKFPPAHVNGVNYLAIPVRFKNAAAMVG